MDRPSSFFSNDLAEFVYYRTYARWQPDKRRRETWDEAVDRVMGFFRKIAGGRLSEDTLGEAADYLRTFRALPSMRVMAMGGPAVERSNIAAFNCFSGDTAFVTRTGIRTLRDACGELVEVRTADGSWHQADVQYFGSRSLQRITLEHWNGGKHGRYHHTVDATPDHRWLLLDGTETTTLSVGDKLSSPSLALPEADLPREAIQHGFFYGDGTVSDANRKPFAQVRLCGRKNVLADDIFGEFSRSYPPSCNGDAMIYCGRNYLHWKDLPTTTEASYVSGFLHGLFLADGSPTDGGNLSISTQRDEMAVWIEKNAGLAGYKVLSHRVSNRETNYGQRSSPLHTIVLGTGPSAILQVIAVENLDAAQETYCVVEPETHTFTLANGQVTGNCTYQPLDDILAFPETLYLLMNGCGVGFSVERRYVERLPIVRPQDGRQVHMLVPDTTEGWADALRVGLRTWWDGGDVTFDLSQIRPAGSPLLTKGGRASGPQPLYDLLTFARTLLLGAQGRRLTSVECLDLANYIATVVVVGGVRRCLPAGTRVHTRRGALPIEEVHIGDDVVTDRGYKSVTGFFEQGVQEVVTIHLEGNRTFRCTPNHRVAVLADAMGGHYFKEAADLSMNDRLLFINAACGGVDTTMVSLPEKRTADHSGSVVRQPELSPSTAWFLGEFFANGYVQVTEHDEFGKGGNTQCVVACNAKDKDQIRRVRSWMEDHNLHVQVIGPSAKDHSVKLRSSNRQIARWIYQYKQPKTPLRIPEEVWRGTEAVRSAFLAGVMDGDGSVRGGPPEVVSTCYEEFARDVMRLLATLGIVSELHVRRHIDNEQGWLPLYAVSLRNHHAVRRCQKTLGAYLSRKVVLPASRGRGYTIPNRMARDSVPYRIYKDVWSPYSDMNSDTFEYLMGEVHYTPIKVVDVEFTGDTSKTFDIEVEDGSRFVAEGLLVHNSSEISLGDLDDTDHRDAKRGTYWESAWWRAMSNNSAVYESTPPYEVFCREWEALRTSGTGERGIFNREAAIRTAPGRRKEVSDLSELGTNPCFSAGTLIQTRDGHFPIEQLVGRSVEIWNGYDWQEVDTFRITGEHQPMLRITMQDGTEERVTPYHTMLLEDGRRLPASDLRSGMRLMLSNSPRSHGVHHEDGAYLKGFLVGDGTILDGRAILNLYAPKYGCSRRLIDSCKQVRPGPIRTSGIVEPGFRKDGSQNRRMMQGLGVRPDLVPWVTTHRYRLPVEVFSWDESSKCDFIAGVMDADGTAADTRNGFLYQIVSVHRGWLQDFQRLLLTLGVASNLSKGKDACDKDFGDGYGPYAAKACWRLTISQSASVTLAQSVRFSRLVSFATKPLKYKIKTRRATVVSVDPDGVDPLVYCCTVEGTHSLALTSGFQYGQCGEICLLPSGQCNLSEVVCRSDDTIETLREKVRIATLFGTLQSMLTNFPYLRPRWRENAERERLLGVSLTGQMDCPLLRDGPPDVLDDLRETAVSWNRRYASLLGINQSVAVTCVKPSGTASLVVNAASGVHPRYAPYYVRRVRISASDPLCALLRDAGAPLSPENDDDPVNPRTWVVSFPVKAPDGAVCRNDRTAIEQLEYWLKVKEHWTEHNPSCFTADTKFITDQGVKKFSDFTPGDKVRVLDGTGKWADATVQGFGEQDIWEVEVERCGYHKTIRTTENHLWPVTYGYARWANYKVKEYTTEQLARLDLTQIKQFVTVDIAEKPSLDQKGVLHGIVYGDGSRRREWGKRTPFSFIHLHNDPNGVDSRKLAPLFVAQGYRPIDKGNHVRVYGLPASWKDLPGADADPSYLRGFIAGWFAADGNFGRAITLSSTKRESLEWLQGVAPRAGIAVSAKIGKHFSDGGVAPVTWFTISLSKSSVDTEFFILEGKGSSFKGSSHKKYWRIVSVQPTGDKEQVYCVDEPVNHHFVLDGGILTHNCTVYVGPDEWDAVRDWVYDHFDRIGGLSFLERDNTLYRQAPYEEITREEYERLAAAFPEIDYRWLASYEAEDMTTGSQELACSGDKCEIA